MSSLPAFTPIGATATLAVSAVSSNVALNRSGANQILVLNLGENQAYIDFGDSAKTATTTDTPIPPGGWIMLSVPPGASYAAAITASGTTTLYFTPGDGEFQGAIGGGAGGGTPGNPTETNIVQVGSTAVVTGGVNGLLAVGGNVASGAADSGNPVKVGGVYNAALPTLVAGQRADAQLDPSGNLRVRLMGSATSAADAVSNGSVTTVVQNAVPSNAYNLLAVASSVFNGTSWDRRRGNTTGTIVIPPQGWSYAAATGGIVNTTTAVTIKGAAGASVRNYLTGLTLAADALGGATEVAVRDGAGGTVLWRSKLQTAGLNPTNIQFPTPLYSTANTLLEFVVLTAVTGGVYVDATGYVAP